jgi:hypothetical protein
MKKLIRIIRDYFMKRRINSILRSVPSSVSRDVYLKILDIMQRNINPREAIKLLVSLQLEVASETTEEARKKESATRESYLDRIKASARNIRPLLANPMIYIDYDLLDMKMDSLKKKESLEGRLSLIPETKKSEMIISFLMLAISLVANIYFISLKYGDTFSPNPLVSSSINALFGLIITAAEVIGLLVILPQLPEKIKWFSTKSVIIAGGFTLMLGICCIMLDRRDLIVNTVANVSGAIIQ